MRMAEEFSATELMTCSRGGKSQQCVVIELHGALTKEERAKLLEFMKPSARSDEETPNDVNVTKTLRVVLEPDGVIPHSFARTVEMRVLAKGSKKSVEEHRMTWIDTASYSYP
jgi:hypothetical protein